MLLNTYSLQTLLPINVVLIATLLTKHTSKQACLDQPHVYTYCSNHLTFLNTTTNDLLIASALATLITTYSTILAILRIPTP